jgi:hypothetical protein
MNEDEIVKALTRSVNRRRFVKKLGVASLVGVGTMFGFVPKAFALCSYACCNLCFCPNGNGCSGCACTWCWSCTDSNNRTWRCCECHTQTSDCGDDCNNVNCSWVVTGFHPEKGAAAAPASMP